MLKIKKSIVDELIAENLKLKNRLKISESFVPDIKIREEKLEWIYVATSANYSKRRIFKVGSTISLQKRLSTYNTGRIGDDVFFYCWVKKCYNSKNLDYTIQHLLSEFKCKKSQEMYRGIKFEDLCKLLKTICDNYDAAIDHVNGFVKNRLKKSFEEPDVDVPVVVLDPESENYKHAGRRTKIHLVKMEKNNITKILQSIFSGSKRNAIFRKKDVIDEVASKITGVGKRVIWNEIRSAIGWKDSKSACKFLGSVFKIV